MISQTQDTKPPGLRVMVIHPDLQHIRDKKHNTNTLRHSIGLHKIREPQLRMDEAIGLVGAIDLQVIHQEIITLKKLHPGLFFGTGHVERIGQIIQSEKLDLLVVDTALSPIQQRNLEKYLKCQVIDRTGLILDIFGSRARTAEGRLQVELASVTYQRTRLVKSWSHLERQRGGFGFLGGPGESQLELDKRMLDTRIIKLTKSLEDVKRTRGLQRKARKQTPFPMVALVGYTNAGKSTLFNKLSGADVFAKDQLFATLDPTMRRIRLPSGSDIILSDTVGFISDLPTQLITAFRATLEEVLEADIILHVQDCAHPEALSQKKEVEKILTDLGVDLVARPNIINVLNKVDLLPQEEQDAAREQASRHHNVCISALTGEGLSALSDAIDTFFQEKKLLITVTFDHDRGDVLGWLYNHGDIIKRYFDDHTTTIRLLADRTSIGRFVKLFPDIAVDSTDDLTPPSNLWIN